ncbi:hypothetical protein RO3G_08284 [Rhizopus delemar RA 99-880]|uniref:G-protein coupled receptors family 2 profile 2 domain-containing protein n=3 Tax=Rhizopus TaxID=4842 RepID=I1C549_RHIO9|nr:hypothetical protein RO3G_08284 [Rhizopus delemar RA 99-880]|eukprot:EIE83579.1 hypothetical protein RO3G_08284 [Rhizopus delemar RA 99-880]
MTNQTQLLPNCSKETTLSGLLLQPDNYCNQIPTNMTQEQMTNGMLNLSAIPSNYIIKNCPSPFIKDPLAGTGTTVDNKYLISYLVLPDKMRHPSLLILNLSISIFLFSMVSFFAIGNQERLQCSPNGIAPGEMGAILVFSSFSTTLWCSALILNLHFHTVWNSNFFTNKYLMLNIICWGIPAVVTCVAIGLHSLKFEFASLCLVSMEYVFKLYFYPLAAIICPSFIIHIGTFFYIAKMAIQEKRESDMSQSLSTGKVTSQGVNHRHIVAAVKIQWRALLLAVVAIATVLFYWLAYMTQVRRLTETENNATLVTSWLQCMLTPGNDQDICYEIIKPILPNFSLMVTVDILAALIGFWLFLMFAKRSLWREWNDLIYDIRIACIYRKREKHAEQFFTL